jgi:hypothetical protein
MKESYFFTRLFCFKFCCLYTFYRTQERPAWITAILDFILSVKIHYLQHSSMFIVWKWFKVCVLMLRMSVRFSESVLPSYTALHTRKNQSLHCFVVTKTIIRSCLTYRAVSGLQLFRHIGDTVSLNTKLKATSVLRVVLEKWSVTECSEQKELFVTW